MSQETIGAAREGRP
ncbi:hypothetical protein CJF30_00010865 [Rutstroemia sp. NJR-2017a BBW]|nr:hypothetical protein CJF30_00010865 [Rutstroemia sp. NJR-2017a BBW]